MLHAQPCPITVALEGGLLGAFAWGVLDQLAGVPPIRTGAVSGAGAMAPVVDALRQATAAWSPGVRR